MKKLKLLNKPFFYFLFIFFLFSVFQNTSGLNRTESSKKEISQKISKTSILTDSVEIDEENEAEEESTSQFLKTQKYKFLKKSVITNKDEKFYHSEILKQLSSLKLQTHSPPIYFKLS